MNAVPEQDVESLDEYLDGALPPEDAGRLRERLAREPELAAALAELEAERAARAAVWAALEPSDAHARRFADRVTTAARRQAVWGRVGRYARFGSAAAACLLVGYLFGWANHDSAPGARPPGTVPGTGVNTVGSGGDRVGNSAGRYRVPVGYDEQGRPIMQAFDNLEDARRFAEELRRLRDAGERDSVIIREQF